MKNKYERRPRGMEDDTMDLPFRLSDENDLELCLKYGRIFVWLQAAATL